MKKTLKTCSLVTFASSLRSLYSLLPLLPLLWLVGGGSGQNAGGTGVGNPAPGGGGPALNTIVAKHPFYVILSPKVVRPGVQYKAVVTITEHCPYNSVRVGGAITRDGIEIAGNAKVFYRGIPDHLLMLVPTNADVGIYKFMSQGVADENLGFLFNEQRSLEFDSRSLIVFVQTSQPIQNNLNPVTMRIIALHKDLSPYTGNVEVKVIDKNDVVMKFYKNIRCFQGVARIPSFKRPVPTAKPLWRVVVRAQNHDYVTMLYQARVKDNRIEVNVSSPFLIPDDKETFTVSADAIFYPDMRFFEGEINMTATVVSADGKSNGTVKKIIGYFYEYVEVQYTLAEFRKFVPDLDGATIKFRADIFDPVWIDSTMGYSISKVMKQKVHLKFLGTAPFVYKPGMPFSFQVVAFTTDRTAKLPGDQKKLIRVDAAGQRLDEPIREDGVARFEIPAAPVSGDSFSIDATLDGDPSVTARIVAVQHRDSYKQYFHLTTTTVNPAVGRYIIIHAYSDHNLQYFQFAVLSASDLVADGKVMMQNRQATFDIAVTNEMLPTAHVIAYHLTTDGRLLTAALHFHVSQEVDSDLGMQAHYSKDPTTNKIEMVANAHPGSYVGFSAVNFYQHSLTGGWGVTEQRVNHEMSKFDKNTHFVNSFTFVGAEGSHGDRTVHIPSSNHGIDSQATIESAGLIVITDAVVESLFSTCNSSRHAGFCDGVCFAVDKVCDGVLDCTDGSDESKCPDPEEEERLDPFLRAVSRHQLTHVNPTAKYYPTDWAFKEKMVDYYGKAIVTASVPEDRTLWAVSAFAIHRHKGLQIIRDPVFIEGAPYITMKLQGPSDVRLGEQFAVMVGLTNEIPQTLEALLSLKASDTYSFVHVDDFNYIRAYDPTTYTGYELQTLVVLRGRRSRLINFPVVAKELGEVNVKVVVQTPLVSITKILTVEVLPQGVVADEFTPLFIDLDSTAKYQDFLAIWMPERFKVPLEPRYQFVPGSRLASICLVGDVMGNNFIEDVLTVGNTIALEFHAGESVLYTVAVNLLTLRYLKDSDYLTSDQLQKTMKGVAVHQIRLMSMYVYDREMDWGHFRPFRGPAKENLWFTASVFKWLRLGQIPEWEDYFWVDNTMLERLLKWMMAHQHNTTDSVDLHRRGCFYEPYNETYVFLHFGSTFELDNNTNLALTAHVLIAIAQEPRYLLGSVGARLVVAINNAVTCLENNLKWIREPNRLGYKDAHLVALITYALHVAGSEQKDEAFKQLERLKLGETYWYWTRDGNEVPALSKTQLANFPNQLWQPMEDSTFDSYTIAASSLAMMVYNIRENREGEFNIMKFLQQRRPAMFGWRSTRGTLLALDALRRFAKLEFKRTTFDITVSMNMSLSPPVRHRFDDLNKKSLPSMQLLEVPDAWGQLELQANGTGYALFGVLHEMSVEHEDQYASWNPPLTQRPDLVGTAQDMMPFGLRWEITYSGRNLSHIHFKVKVRYEMEVTPRSNMAVLKVELPSGYHSWDEYFVKYGYARNPPNLIRAKCSGGAAYFFFTYLDNKWTEVKFTVQRWFPVANMSQWHAITVYDYYEPMMTSMRLYTTIGLKNLDICKVCGSFQCPYCFDYNAAPSSFRSSASFLGVVGVIVALGVVIFADAVVVVPSDTRRLKSPRSYDGG